MFPVEVFWLKITLKGLKKILQKVCLFSLMVIINI